MSNVVEVQAFAYMGLSTLCPESTSFNPVSNLTDLMDFRKGNGRTYLFQKFQFLISFLCHMLGMYAESLTMLEEDVDSVSCVRI